MMTSAMSSPSSEPPSTTTRVYQPRRYIAPERPSNAPDIDYGGMHPFEQNSNDWNSRGRRRRRLRESSSSADDDGESSSRGKIVRKLSLPSKINDKFDNLWSHHNESEDNSDLFEPIRIHFDVHDLEHDIDTFLTTGAGFSKLQATKLHLLAHKVLPATAELWGSVLRVIPVHGISSSTFDDDDDNTNQASAAKAASSSSTRNPHSSSSTSPSDEAEPGTRAYYCPPHRTSTAKSTLKGDIQIYVTTNKHCGVGSDGEADSTTTSAATMLASAVSCERDQYDRPITGSIDFCLGGMVGTDVVDDLRGEVAKAREEIRKRNTGKRWRRDEENKKTGPVKQNEESKSKQTQGAKQNQGNSNAGGASARLSKDDSNYDVMHHIMGVAIHELGHVLGVSSDSLPYFRHPLTGKPLTRRPFGYSTVTCVDGHDYAYHGVPSKSLLKQSTTRGGKTYYEVTSPTVRQVVRNHFDCQTLEGARLENQPTSLDCFGSHWDERLFYSEVMGAIHSDIENSLSPLTLALLEDSGWYRANYKSPFVTLSPFGHGAGCDFVEQNCLNPDGSLPDFSVGSFCNVSMSVDPRTGGVIRTALPQTCDPTHQQKTTCDFVDSALVPRLPPPPPEFRYIPKLPSMRPYAFDRSDFCPVPHLNPIDCKDPSNRGSGPGSPAERAGFGEKFGQDSMCYDAVGSRDYSICLQSICNVDIGRLQIRIRDGVVLTCEYDGQIHTITKEGGANDEGDGVHPTKGHDTMMKIRCPRVAQVCPDLVCPANCAGRGRCEYRTEGTMFNDGSTLAGRCVCNAGPDRSDGCYGANLYFPKNYGDSEWDARFVILLVALSLAFLSLVFIIVRKWRKKRHDRVEATFVATNDPNKDVNIFVSGRGNLTVRTESDRSHRSHRIVEKNFQFVQKKGSSRGSTEN